MVFDNERRKSFCCSLISGRVFVHVIMPPMITLMSLYVLNVVFGYTGITLVVVNAPVPSILSVIMWLRSQRLADLFLRYVGHRCGKGDESSAAAVGIYRTSPVLPALSSIMMLVITFWHVVAMFMLADL